MGEKKAALTGATSPIGLALIRKLLSENYQILAFVRKDSDRINQIPKDDRIVVEYYSLSELKEYDPKETDFEVFYHVGWANTWAEYREDIVLQNLNVGYATDAVLLAKNLGCESFVGVGSQAEYGRKDKALTVSTECNPETAYGIAKLHACYSTRYLCEKLGIKYNWVRVLSAYGTRGYVGPLLTRTIDKASKDEVLEFTAGEQIWDYIYYDDLAEALYLTHKNGVDGKCYPIGSGETKTLREYLEILLDVMGKSHLARFGEIPYSDAQIMHLEADISEVCVDTGWKPVTSFEEGIRKTIDYQLDTTNSIYRG